LASSFDTLLALYTGTNLTLSTQIASSDDFHEFTTDKTSRVQTFVSAGTTYYIAIDGFNGDLATSCSTGRPPSC